VALRGGLLSIFKSLTNQSHIKIPVDNNRTNILKAIRSFLTRSAILCKRKAAEIKIPVFTGMTGCLGEIPVFTGMTGCGEKRNPQK
ncbi:MAG: hypothetical protein SNI54_07650, partial [Rikenellaceae bacterium]